MSSNPDRNILALTSFDDPAFEPQAGFDFEDSSGNEFRNMQNDIASLNFFNNGGSAFTNMMDGQSGAGSQSGIYTGTSGPFPGGTGAFTPGLQGMSATANIAPTDVWSNLVRASAGTFNSGGGSGLRIPDSLQSDIVSRRGATVTQQHGQITPPDDSPDPVHIRRDSKNPSPPQAAQSAKLDKSQRARNAANQRHSKKKAVRARSESGAEGSEGEEDGKKEKYREKNRLAAAKCRAKKKGHVEELEERFRALSAMHNCMKREVMTLRNTMSDLRGKMLQHNAATCQCEPIHEYNKNAARNLAYGISKPAMSPSTATSPSIASPGPFDIMGRTASLPGSDPNAMMDLDLSNLSGRPQSFSGPSNYAFAPVTTPESLQQRSSTATAGEDTSSFANFLRSSPGGRAGFN